MITEHDLQEAIAECQGARNPNASTCIKLAAFLIIQKEMFGSDQAVQPALMYSQESAPAYGVVDYYSDTEFGEIVEGRKQSEVFSVLDELMSTLQVVQPRLYDSVIRKLK